MRRKWGLTEIEAKQHCASKLVYGCTKQDSRWEFPSAWSCGLWPETAHKTFSCNFVRWDVDAIILSVWLWKIFKWNSTTTLGSIHVFSKQSRLIGLRQIRNQMMLSSQKSGSGSYQKIHTHHSSFPFGINCIDIIFYSKLYNMLNWKSSESATSASDFPKEIQLKIRPTQLPDLGVQRS